MATEKWIRYTRYQTQVISEQVNSGNSSFNGILVKDIMINQNVLKDDKTPNGTPRYIFTPISATSGNSYSGIFDGNGHTISGLYVNKSSGSQFGLFGYVKRGTVRNLGLIDSYISGFMNIGGIVGYLDGGTVINCYSDSYIDGSDYVGGVVGQFKSGTVTNCYNMGYIRGSSGVGGVVGLNYAELKDCYNSGSIKGYYHPSSIGGVAGINDGTITGCYNTGTVDGTKGSSSQRIGGVVGFLRKGVVTNCYNTGDVIGMYYAGGVVGEVRSNTTVENCYNTGTVYTSTQYTGGVAGYNSGTVKSSYSTGKVDGKNNIGGVAGFNNTTGIIENCYYLIGGEASESGALYGIGYGENETPTADAVGITEGKSAYQFSFGEVAYLLGGDWGQDVRLDETDN